MTLLSMLSEMESLTKIVKGLDLQGVSLLTGVIDAQKAQVIAYLATLRKAPVVVVTYQEKKASDIRQDLSFFLPENIQCNIFPVKDMLFYAADTRSKEIDEERMEIFYLIDQQIPQVIVLSAEALRDKLIPKEKFLSKSFHLSVGDETAIEELIKKLHSIGYQRVDTATATGQYAARGGIVDIFSKGHDEAFRLEFWGDEIESIRFLDSDSRLSAKEIETDESVYVFPAKEFIFDEGIFAKGVDAFKKAWKAYEKKMGSTTGLKEEINEIIERMENEGYFPSIEKFIDFFYPVTEGVLDYLPEGSLVIWDEPTRIQEHSMFVEREFSEILTYQMEDNKLFSMDPWVFDYNSVLHQVKKKTVLALSTLSTSVPDFSVKEIESMMVKSIQFNEKSMEGLLEELRYYEQMQYKIVILQAGETKAKRLVEELNKEGKKAAYVSSFQKNKLDHSFDTYDILVGSWALSSGFEYPLERFVLISGKELFGKEKKKKKKRKSKDTRKMDTFIDLKINDYVVHDNHGVGVYKGIENVESGGVSADYLKITYADGGILYVHTGQMDLIQKYIGADAARPKVNKLGGSEWVRSKQAARTSVKKLAFNLVELEAKRSKIKGFAFSKDTIWQKEFEEAFPFEETFDQEEAIFDIKKDMESDKVMDRLLCGDVGFGKTEVAIRGAFKAVQDNKQVAFLVPTTILAQQHFNTLLERFKNFPVEVEVLSRFRTEAQQKEILQKLRDGRIDIIIATHRLLSKDVAFKDLGLLIIDEEQRFGVGHKEKLKVLKENVDVLTLTATPIPRTLHMSLSGIRDMSLLEEPPEDRKPIQTYVLENESIFVREAISRELDRGGQVYYVFNRVKGIVKEAAMLQEMLPEARIAYAHGQMSERRLEEVMMDFIAGEIDVLVTTTIVETGLDIPNVNTMIITNADTFGLSQLYQLRGRVGRSHRLAFCYLLYAKNKVLSEVATKRLQTIREFTKFGSGFKIAMRDLEIRGAGDLLGAEQHGYMDSVGYDTYSRILAEEVAILKGDNEVVESRETSVELSVDGYIPSYYMQSEEEKIDMYKRIAYIRSVEDKDALINELLDMYGPLPKEVYNLLEVALIKGLANTLGISRITERNHAVLLFVDDTYIGDVSKIEKAMTTYMGRFFFTTGKRTYFSYKLDKEEEIVDILPVLVDILVFMQK